MQDSRERCEKLDLTIAESMKISSLFKGVSTRCGLNIVARWSENPQTSMNKNDRKTKERSAARNAIVAALA